MEDKNNKVDNTDEGLIIEYWVRNEFRRKYGTVIARGFTVKSIAGLTRLITIRRHGEQNKDEINHQLASSQRISQMIQTILYQLGITVNLIDPTIFDLRQLGLLIISLFKDTRLKSMSDEI